ncbi:MAG: hypothetical protein J6F30_04700 [Cellulosilyticum sp.]|nr:hypothetical protein [Cellulosilyticum sp.]
MGTIRNEMTIVHHWNKDRLKKVREDAIKVFGQVIGQDGGVEEYIKNMISPIMQSYVNGEYTFVINGDCSKIGWETSERFHEARIEWCRKHRDDVQNIVVINFGEDEPCRVVFDSRARIIMSQAYKQPSIVLAQSEQKAKWINKRPRWIPSLSMTIQDAYECSNCGEPGVHWWKHCIYCGRPMEIEDWMKPIIEGWRSHFSESEGVEA